MIELIKKGSAHPYRPQLNENDIADINPALV